MGDKKPAEAKVESVKQETGASSSQVNNGMGELVTAMTEAFRQSLGSIHGQEARRNTR